MPHASTAFALVLGTTLSAAVLVTQQPRITNGQVAVQPAGSPFLESFQALVTSQADVAWIGYSVPAMRRDRSSCCFGAGTTVVSGGLVVSHGSGWVGCRLEPAAKRQAAPAGASLSLPAGPVKLEGPDQLVVMFRVAGQRVERIRVFSEDCDLDAGGRPVHWLENVRPADSVALLASHVDDDAHRRLSNQALSALALHEASQSAVALERLARNHPTARVRGEALFWLAHKAGDKAVGQITAAIEQDPDTEVKKRAVFALSQLPRDEGIPLLMKVARTHPNPAVKRQAMFWLGQSKDPRAIAFFAEILK